MHSLSPTAGPPHPEPSIGRLDTPLGPLLVAATARGIAAVRIGRRASRRETLDGLRRRGLASEAGDEALLAATLAELRRYFAGELRTFALPVDLRGVSDFTAAVLAELRGLPFGERITYGALARRLTRPGAVRAVGGALSRNPVPIVIPCHRVVGAKGPGGFSAGRELKRWLLRHEGGERLLAR